ncbi:MAG: FKBP-type peptidyl-prolyl cis-trans isomerase [Candidatus Korarchaeota archaeon]
MIKEKDIVLIDYVLKTETGELVDTTIEEEAKKAGLKVFSYPYFLRIGDKMLFEEVEKALVGKNVNEEIEVKIPPEHAFGQRDKNLVKTMSINKFIKLYGKTPNPGDTVTEGNKEGRVIFAGQGRVTIDFNNPRAGLSLIFKGKVVKILTEKDEIFRELLKKDFELKNIDDFKIEQVDEEYKITIPYSVWSLESGFRGKHRLIFDIMRYFPDMKGITFIEKWERKEEKKEVNEEKKEEIIKEVK